MRVKLIYPAPLCGRPHVAEVTVNARLTPRQIVVECQKNPEVVYMDGRTTGLWFGMVEVRYWRRHGGRVGGDSMMRFWRLAPGELERLNA